MRDTTITTVTLADVARRARVSPATASRVINGSQKPVADELRERVVRAVEDLRYVPNAHARMLARAERGAAGVIVHDVSDPYFAEITRGLQRTAIARGTLLVICNSYRDPDPEREYVELLTAQRVSAIVLAGSGYHDARATRALNAALRRYTDGGGRVAIIGRHALTGDAIQPANEAGARLIGDHLYGLGHRLVGVIAGPRDLTTTTDRLTGMRAAARTRGQAVPPRYVGYGDFSRDSGAAVATELLDRAPGLTALAVQNDAMAIGALAVARARCLSVPGDLTVVGFDDMPIAQDVTPASPPSGFPWWRWASGPWHWHCPLRTDPAGGSRRPRRHWWSGTAPAHPATERAAGPLTVWPPRLPAGAATWVGQILPVPAATETPARPLRTRTGVRPARGGPAR